MSSNMEGLSLGGCIQRFINICMESLLLYQKSLSNCQHWCLPFGCAGDRHTGSTQFFVFWTWGLSTGRTGDEEKCDIPSRNCSESCLGKQTHSLLPWPRMCSPVCPVLSHGLLGMLGQTLCFFSTEKTPKCLPSSSMISQLVCSPPSQYLSTFRILSQFLLFHLIPVPPSYF